MFYFGPYVTSSGCACVSCARAIATIIGNCVVRLTGSMIGCLACLQVQSVYECSGGDVAVQQPRSSSCSDMCPLGVSHSRTHLTLLVRNNLSTLLGYGVVVAVVVVPLVQLVVCEYLKLIVRSLSVFPVCT